MMSVNYKVWFLFLNKPNQQFATTEKKKSENHYFIGHYNFAKINCD